MRVFLYARRMFKCEATVSEGKEVKNKKKQKESLLPRLR